jgi:rhodanese-related sulfurtransferase
VSTPGQAFAGQDDNAVVDGDFACQEQELQPVLRSLRKSEVNIVAIHQHMTQEQPRYVSCTTGVAAKRPTSPTPSGWREASKPRPRPLSRVTPAAFRKSMRRTLTNIAAMARLVLDVRSPEEFAKGHVPGALNVDINAPGFASKVSTFDKSKPILLNCHAGSRGAIASAELAKLGFKTVCNLEGGLAAWEKAGNQPETSPQK